MSASFSTSLRTAIAQAIITAAGANAKLKLYNGTKPSSLGAPSGTLLATLTAGTVLGTAGSGSLDFDEASFTQTNSSHVAGTPTFVRIETSGGTAVADIDIGAGAGNFQFTGTVATGQNVTLTNLAFAVGNP